MTPPSAHRSDPAGSDGRAGSSQPAEPAETVEAAGTTDADVPLPAAPRVLCDARALAGDPPSPAGVLWKLEESGRELDANIVRLAPGGRVAPHREPDLDVLLYVVSGGGVLGAGAGDEPLHLAEGATAWLPHGSTRSITAGEEGLAYLTVHRRRPGMRIRRRDEVS
ncbi:procyclic form-specific polypeptide B-alpha [Streptomyces carpinensis]|uniref:procyclic form-specific polypeptide B-alpha n=1 Tax=Streptomyces carpinensis TaxID=66369 RepID=UPI001FC9028A|nr:procyclic form-specific polypeptide B-alpha [Streptomyces carpinensis]